MLIRALLIGLFLSVPAGAQTATVEGPFKPDYPFVSIDYLSCPRMEGQRVRCVTWIDKPYTFPVTWAIHASQCQYDQSPFPLPDLSLIGDPAMAGSSGTPPDGWCEATTNGPQILWPACHCFEVVQPNPRAFGPGDCDCFYPDSSQ